MARPARVDRREQIADAALTAFSEKGFRLTQVSDVARLAGIAPGTIYLFAKGKEVYNQAIAKGNTPERDELYGRAFTVLSKAMQIYSALCEKKPDDGKLGEKLHQCMQLRYGAVKQRRFE